MSSVSRIVCLLSPGGRTAPGGIAKVVDYTARYWPHDSAYKVKILDTYGPGPQWVMPLFFLSSALALLIGLVKHEFSLVHLNMAERLSVWRKISLAFLAQRFDVPVVLHLHGAEFANWYTNSTRLSAFLVRAVMRRCTAVVCLGAASKEFLIGHVGLSEDKVRVIQNGVPDFCAPHAKQRESCRFLFVGALIERKGITTLLDALAQPELASLTWNAVIIGGGAINHYRKYVETLGIADRVVFLGAAKESIIHSQLSMADVFVLPSKSEGLPLAILEAMSFGCAIVATLVGDVSEAVIPQVTGILIPVGNVVALANVLCRLASDEALCASLGRGARQYYEARFTIGHYLYSLKETYDRCLMVVAAPDAPPQPG